MKQMWQFYWRLSPVWVLLVVQPSSPHIYCSLDSFWAFCENDLFLQKSLKAEEKSTAPRQALAPNSRQAAESLLKN